jgi:L-arabinose transport system substrate-binding protein
MKHRISLVTVILLGCVLVGGLTAQAKPKIGFLVKLPEASWFQTEWKFADQAGQDLGFEVIKIGTQDGEKVLNAIDNLAAQGAQGFVICTPDTKLGPAIMTKAKSLKLRVLAVDDQFVKGDGSPMTDVPYLGISARKIGESVGETLFQEMKRRGWNMAETGAMAITLNELQTSRDRTDGTKAALIRLGFPASNIYEGAQKQPGDVETGFNAAATIITQHAGVKNWLIYSLAEDCVIGGVRALEGRGFKTPNILGVGIGGATVAINEFKKGTENGFYGTILLAARVHGYETAKMMYQWITKGTTPPMETRTAGTLITRANYMNVMKENGLEDLVK